MRPLRLLALLACALAGAAPPAVGQAARRDAPSAASGSSQPSPRVEIALPSTMLVTEEGPLVHATEVLADSKMRDLLRSGFPALLHFKVELWSASGWLDDLEGATEWDIVVRYDPLGKSYRVARIIRDRVESIGQFQEYADAVAAAERPFRAPIRAPRGRDRFYYNAVLDIEVVSLSDLDEVERWLRGELRPAVRGQRNPATAVTRGVRTLVVRLLGGEKRHYTQRTPVFRGTQE